MTVENGKPEEQVAEKAAATEHETVEEFVLNEEGGVPLGDEAEPSAGNELQQQVETLTRTAGTG